MVLRCKRPDLKSGSGAEVHYARCKSLPTFNKVTSSCRRGCTAIGASHKKKH